MNSSKLLFNRNNQIKSLKKNQTPSLIRHNKRGADEVIKLSLYKYFLGKSSSKDNLLSSSIESKNSSKENILDENKKNKNVNSNKNNGATSLSQSIRKIKLFFPEIKDSIFKEDYASGHIPSRKEHIKFENSMKDQIEKLTLNCEELERVQNRIDEKILKIDNDIIDIQCNIDIELNFSNNSLKARNSFIKFKGDKELSHKDMELEMNLFLLRQEQNKKQKAKEYNDQIDKKKSEKQKLIEVLEKNKMELKKMHEKRKKTTERLYIHYLNILHNGKDTRNEGLSWAIREIFKLNKKVIMSFLPEFLDKSCIHYLFKVAHLTMKIIEIEKQIKETKSDFKSIGLINPKKKNDLPDYLTERNCSTKENLEKLKTEFCVSFNNKKKLLLNTNENNLTTNLPNLKVCKTFCTNKSMEINTTKKNPVPSNFHNRSNSINHSLNVANNNIRKEIYRSLTSKMDENLPFINGDPNENLIKNMTNEVIYTNKFAKEQYRTYINIPPIIKLKDIDKLDYYNKINFNNEELTKIHDYFSLMRKLNELRAEKQLLKRNEMNRIFKEFQRNNYAQKYNVDKNTLICALVGEDNLDSELFRQSKKEKQYLEEISKSQLHRQSIYGMLKKK